MNTTIAITIICVAFIAGVTIVAKAYLKNINDREKDEAEIRLLDIDAKKTLGQCALRNDVLRSKIADIKVSGNNPYNPSWHKTNPQPEQYEAWDCGFKMGSQMMKDKAKDMIQNVNDLI